MAQWLHLIPSVSQHRGAFASCCLCLYHSFRHLYVGRQILFFNKSISFILPIKTSETDSGRKNLLFQRGRDKHSNNLHPLPSFLKESSLLCHLKQNSANSSPSFPLPVPLSLFSLLISNTFCGSFSLQVVSSASWLMVDFNLIMHSLWSLCN